MNIFKCIFSFPYYRLQTFLWLMSLWLNCSGFTGLSKHKHSSFFWDILQNKFTHFRKEGNYHTAFTDLFTSISISTTYNIATAVNAEHDVYNQSIMNPGWPNLDHKCKSCPFMWLSSVFICSGLLLRATTSVRVLIWTETLTKGSKQTQRGWADDSRKSL